MKKIIPLLIATTSLFAQEYDYSYFTNGLPSDYAGTASAPNSESISYISQINAIQFGSSASNNNMAVSYNSSAIKAWATGYSNYNVGTIENQVDANWQTPENIAGAITKVEPTEKVCVLGNGGSIVISFESGISNGSGIDFAIFENGFDENYLELGFVEVSTNGIDFVRFPNFYLGTERIYEWQFQGNCDVMPTDVYNLASKFECGMGHGFDLQELIYTYEGIINNSFTFSDSYTNAFLSAYSTLDFDNINYVKIVDVYGDGTVLDSIGHPIYDPTGNQRSSPGFDIQGIAVLNTSTIPEPSSYAIILGIFTLIVSSYRKKL